jgi:hypothetical protein
VMGSPTTSRQRRRTRGRWGATGQRDVPTCSDGTPQVRCDTSKRLENTVGNAPWCATISGQYRVDQVPLERAIFVTLDIRGQLDHSRVPRCVRIPLPLDTF